MSGLGLSLFREGSEIGFLNMVQKARDSLIDTIGQRLIPRIEDPAQFKDRRETVINVQKGCVDLSRSTPGEIKKNLSIGHLSSFSPAQPRCEAGPKWQLSGSLLDPSHRPLLAGTRLFGRFKR